MDRLMISLENAVSMLSSVVNISTRQKNFRECFFLSLRCCTGMLKLFNNAPSWAGNYRMKRHG